VLSYQDHHVSGAIALGQRAAVESKRGGRQPYLDQVSALVAARPEGCFLWWYVERYDLHVYEFFAKSRIYI
jgi:hypothetical protein